MVAAASHPPPLRAALRGRLTRLILPQPRRWCHRAGGLNKPRTIHAWERLATGEPLGTASRPAPRWRRHPLLPQTALCIPLLLSFTCTLEAPRTCLMPG